MPDFQGLLQSAYQGYRQSKEEEMDKKRLAMQMAQAGLVETPEGKYSLSDEAKKERAWKRATEQAGLLKSGQKIGQYDPTSDTYSLEGIPGFRDIEEENKRLQNLKLKKELNQKDVGKIMPAGEATNLGSADASVEELNQYNQLLKNVEDISGSWTSNPLGRFGAAIKEPFQFGETGKRAAQADAARDKAAQVLGTYLEGGKLTDADTKKYINMLPSRSDTPDVRDSKVQVLQRLIATRKNAQIGSLGTAGFDVSGMKRLQEPDISKIGLLSVKNKKKTLPGLVSGSIADEPKGGQRDPGMDAFLKSQGSK
jgi:hypothetical protein